MVVPSQGRVQGLLERLEQRCLVRAGNIGKIALGVTGRLHLAFSFLPCAAYSWRFHQALGSVHEIAEDILCVGLARIELANIVQMVCYTMHLNIENL